jgi:hypothetical protein
MGGLLELGVAHTGGRVMGLGTWSRSEVQYGRRILDSGLKGVRSGQESFLKGARLSEFLGASSRSACPSVVLGACLGVLASRPRKNRSLRRSLAFGIVSGAIGFTAAFAWKSRGLAASAVRDAARNIHVVRDERWMQKHSIAYA